MSAVPPEITILRTLTAAGEGFVSGTTLAETLGMSRVAVWQHMEKLREQGFTFEAVRSRGYRMTAHPEHLNQTLISARLTDGIDCRLIVLDSIDSTNDEALRRLSQGETSPLAVIAREQTKGRGRLGRQWLSEPNGNLYISFAFRPNVPPDRVSTITPWIGANLCGLIASYCRISPQIKWPNDLLMNGRKIGGILTEARIDADRIRDLVVGCGLNLRPPTQGWPAELAPLATSLAEATPAPIDVNHFAAALIGRIQSAYSKFQDDNYRNQLADLWIAHDALKGREITLLHGKSEVTGTAIGIDDEGSLLLRIPSGGTRRFRAGEVTIAKR